MNSSNNIASPLSSPLLQRLSPLNGNGSSSSCSNSTNRINLNRQSYYNQEQQQKENSQRQNVHLNGNNDNGACSSSPVHHQYQRSPPFPLWSSINSSFSSDDSKQFEGTLASAQDELDAFLDWYEEKHGLEPLDMNQVQGLSRLITGTSQDGACYQKTAQISQRDSRKTPIKSPFSSLDLSCLPVATLSQDDIQDKSNNNSNNNSSKDLKFRGKKQPLSPIREDKKGEEVEDAAAAAVEKNVTKNSDDDHDRQKGMKQDAEVKNGKSASAAVKKTSDPPPKKRVSFAALPPSPPPQQPQRIDNSKNGIVIGEKDKIKENCTTPTTTTTTAAPEVSTPKCLVKLPIERRIPSEAAMSLSGPTCTVAAAKSHHRLSSSKSASLVVQKSKIPVPLPKTKINTAAAVNEKGNECRSSASSKICNDDTAVNTVQKIRNNNNNNRTTTSTTPPPLKKQFMPHRVIPVSHKVTQGTQSNPESSTCRNNNNSNSNKLNKAATRSERKIGQGDEVSEYLGLIDGLSRQTTWVMNKVLEYPISHREAIKRINTLKASPEIGDFFGAPYIKKEALTHMLFSNGHFSKP